MVLVAACSGGDDTATPEATAPPTTAAGPAPEGTPPEIEAFAADWPTAGQDLFNTRAAASSTITSENIDQLEEGWRTAPPDIGSLSTVPLIVGEDVFLQGGTGTVAALDRASGAVVWSTGPGGFNIGPFGVAVGYDKVFALAGSIGVQAVDSATGEHLWDTQLTPNDTTGIDIQPVVADGLVIASTVPISVSGIYAPGDRGVIYALDAETGDVVWEFDTVDGDLWGHPEVNSGGGAWYPPVVDLERRRVYVGVANPAPFPGTAEFPNGSSRPGDNLYTNSIVALDLDTGELDWFHQVTPHDIFDRDQVHTLMADLDDGTQVIVSAGKSGVMVGLDPDDGTVRWETPVGVHDNDDLAELDGPTFVNPGTYGGILTPPATADGVVYAGTVDAATELQPDETAYFGAPLGTEDGEVTAVDADTGEVLWETDVPGDPLGGTAVVNDLVLTALMDGTLLALDRESGEIVWTGDAGGGVNGWLSAAGDDLYIPVGNASPPALLNLTLP
jgi:outer membrane protein assembly factor BamB